MNSPQRIYFDHAATSWPKSDAVLRAMDDFHRNEGASAGRSAYTSAMRSAAKVSECRRRISDLIGSPSPECVSFHCSGTAALNSAIHGLVRPGDHVVTTAAEHNSVLRPLEHLHQRHDVRLSVVPCDQDGRVGATEVMDAVRPGTRLVAVTHASNVTGAVQPIQEIGDGLKNRDTVFLCDAAQTFGCLPIDVANMNVDVLAAPGHKGGGGPLGTAFLYCDPKLHNDIEPTIQGGTGTHSESLEMPVSMPERLEPGNLNVPAIVGWNAALAELMDGGVTRASNRCREMASRLYEGLADLSHLGVKVIGSPGALPVISTTIDGLAPSDASAILDSEYAIETRSGYHCAALIHRYLRTTDGGTLRISAGRMTSNQELDAVLTAVAKIATVYIAQ